MAYSKRQHGGTIVNVIIALVFFGLLGYGIMWLIKGYGQAGQQYAETMVQAKHDATSVKCQMNLRTTGAESMIPPGVGSVPIIIGIAARARRRLLNKP